MSPAAKAELVKKNQAVIDRMAARREVRRLRQNKKKVPAELLKKAGFQDGLSLGDRRVREVAKTVATRSGSVVVKTKNRQEAAKELGIKNRRWMTTAELDEAINLLATAPANQSEKPTRLLALEQLGRDRCKAAWDAWKAKQPKANG